MPIKKTDSRMEAGVKLTLVEEVMPMGKVRSQRFRLTIRASTSPACSPSVRPWRTPSI